MATLDRKVVSQTEYFEERQRRLSALDRTDPSVKLVLSGKTYTAEFNNRAVKGVLKDCGVNLILGLDRETLNNPVSLGSVFYWSLKKHQPDLTQDDADDIFDYKSYLYVVDKLRLALTLFSPNMDDLEFELPQKAPDGETDPT